MDLYDWCDINGFGDAATSSGLFSEQTEKRYQKVKVICPAITQAKKLVQKQSSLSSEIN